MAQRASVQALHPASEEQALAWLRSQGRVTISASELGRRWSWHRQRVGRRLHAWATTGKIDRRGKTITWKSGTTPVPRGVTNAGSGAEPVTAPRHTTARTNFWRIILIILLVFLAVTLAIILMTTNVTSFMSFAKSSDARYAFGALGLTIDAMAVTLPAAIAMAPLRTKIPLTVMWLVTVFIIGWTQVGYAFSNLGDVVGSRRATIERRDIVEDRLTSLRKQLAAVPAYIPATKEQADAAVDERKRQCDGGSFCTRAKNNESKVLAAREITVRAAKIADDVERYEKELGLIPVLAAADPQITGGVTAVKLIGGYSLDQAYAAAWRDVTIAMVLTLFPGGLIRGAISLVRD